MNEIKPKVLQALRENYPAGTRVKAISIDDPYTEIPIGTKGTVECIDDTGTRFIKWDNGARLGVVYGVDTIAKI